jgi:hypothetical protein
LACFARPLVRALSVARAAACTLWVRGPVLRSCRTVLRTHARAASASRRGRHAAASAGRVHTPLRVPARPPACLCAASAGLSDGLRASMEPLVAASQLPALLPAACGDASHEVRQSAFALLGDLARACPRCVACDDGLCSWRARVCMCMSTRMSCKAEAPAPTNPSVQRDLTRAFPHIRAPRAFPPTPAHVPAAMCCRSCPHM